MNIRYPIYEGVYRILTFQRKGLYRWLRHVIQVDQESIDYLQIQKQRI